MKLKKCDVSFTSHPFLTKSISDKDLASLNLKHFDKDGYEVPALIERAYYIAEGVELNNEIQYHIAPVQEWYRDLEDAEQGLVLDHCMLLTRYALSGEAREQVQLAAKQRPILNKLLGISPKYGIDFSLDYVDHDICMEVIHIEQDFVDYSEANAAKERLELIIETTDWEQGARDLIACKSKWIDLSSDDHSDFKAQFFGWHRAFDNKKVFSS